MHKKISEMTVSDKAEYLEATKRAVLKVQGIPWKIMEDRITEEIENTFNDEKLVRMNPESRIDAAYDRKEFGAFLE